MLEPTGGQRQKRSIDGPIRSRRIVIAKPGISPQTSQPDLLTPAFITPTLAVSSSSRLVKQRSTKRRRNFVTSLIAVPIVALLAIITYIFWPQPATHKLSALSLATSVIKSSVGVKATLSGQSEGRTNILVYGMTKDVMRTDSIMLVSYYWNQKKVVTLNIPRDLQVNDGFETAKFGEVYAYAKLRQPKDPSYPSQFVADLIAKEYGVPVQYWVKLNMQGEVDLVNTLGGIDIEVPAGFTDYAYPTWNYSGYIHPAPSFTAGLQHMNGDTSLIYSRSRHSLDNGQGTDFARSQRQMLVAAAVLTKVKSLGILGNIGDISHYLSILGANVDTNMTTDEIVTFAGNARALNTSTDLLRGNWSTENGFLCSSTTSAGAYIALYGVVGNCKTSAGGQSDSKYREYAIYYVQNLIDAAQLSPTSYIQTAGQSLPSPYTVPTTASTGGSTSSVLGASTTPTSSSTTTRR
jgi:LCP family protein required for cell wall assembly